MDALDNSFCKAIVVRLFRLWAMSREDGSVGLSRMHEVALQLRLADETVPACASLFQLVEAELGRPLKRECCCARNFSADEIALLGVIEAAPSVAVTSGTQEVPHGLAGAIRWAAMSVRQAIDWPESLSGADLAPSRMCPFAGSRPGAHVAF